MNSQKIEICDSYGSILKSEIAWCILNDEFALTIESQGGLREARGCRNPDYQKALEIILERANKMSQIVDIRLVSRPVLRHHPDGVRVHLSGYQYPIQSMVEEPRDFRIRIGREVASLCRKEGAKGKGNDTKRLTLIFKPPCAFSQFADYLSTGVLASSGEGDCLYLFDSKLRRLIECYSMEKAKIYYRRLGFDVEDVSETKSFDLRCVKEGDHVRVEVKGTQGIGASVILTKNEVHVSRQSDYELFVVSNIDLDCDGNCRGGLARVFRNPSVSDADLVPLSYEYRLPGNGVIVDF